MYKKWAACRRHRCASLFSGFIVILIIYTIMVSYTKDSIECFDETVIGGVADILDDESQPPPKGKSIFFHETSCGFQFRKTFTISPRQGCAVESAARMNPNMTVYLLYASPIKFPNASFFRGKSERILNELLKYDNIRIRRVDLNRYTKDTPLERWYATRQLQRSTYPNSHASDVLRYLSLWKYGGTYLDLDVVVMKNLETLGSNYAAAESHLDVAAGVLNFDHEGFGHDVANICLREIRYNFKGNDWGHNGPGVITRTLQKVCQDKKVKSMTPVRCKGFNVLAPSSFYPISWKNWSLYFDPEKIHVALNMIKSSYAIHVWNKFSKDSSISKSHSEVLYSMIAKKFCPKVFKESGDYF